MLMKRVSVRGARNTPKTTRGRHGKESEEGQEDEEGCSDEEGRQEDQQEKEVTARELLARRFMPAASDRTIAGDAERSIKLRSG
ncbi:hypothetical protein [Bradyrhizobium sp. AZCC 2230]|uniref:hypothetical protein n=1 Tax=Bradyrhizobium sp. AZCC 2230 TaxID=3117021 RepID=UPI002FEEAB1B